MTDVERTPHGRIAVSRRALVRLVVDAAERVEGARVRRPRRGVTVRLADGAARCELSLAVQRGRVLPVVAREVQRRVSQALAEALEARVEAVDVTVEEVV